MKIFRILFLIGLDRPGIVDDVSTFLLEHGANIEDSRMATLGGRFSAVILFSSRQAGIADIESGLGRLTAMGLEVSLHGADEPAAVPRPAELPLRIQAASIDHPGIVQQIVHLLRRHGVNIHALNTSVLPAPLSGAPLFNLVLQAGVPAETSIGVVKEALEQLATLQNLDLNFPPEF
jgi:glycine cleavage system transcriptional repressor